MKKKLILAILLSFLTANIFAQSIPTYIPSNGLVGWWPFNGNANDSSGNNYNGIVNGPILTTDRFGSTNFAYQFDGINDAIQLPVFTNGTINNEMSISVWLNNQDNTDHQSVYLRQGANFTKTWILKMDDNNELRVYNENGSYTSYVSPSTLFGSWYNLIVTFQSNNIKIYIDGTLVQSDNISIPLSWTNDTQLLGFSGGTGNQNYPFIGKMDDLAIWNRALTSQEVSQVSSGCSAPPPVSLGTSGTTVLCPNESVDIFVVTPTASSSLSYQWTRNGTNLPLATSRNISVSDAANYKVFVSSGPSLNCRRVSGLIQTTATTPPSIVISAPNGTALCPGDSVLMTASGATAGYSYRWKRFGVVIAGATSNIFYASQTGNYRCEVYNAGGCITQSNLITISNGTSCRVMGEMDSDVSVYPNPAQNNFTVSFNDIGSEIPVSISLRNLHGQVIETRAVTTTENTQFSVAKLAPGMYVVSIQLESGDTIEKTVVVK